MPTRDELESIARQWLSLWSVPVDWALFDRLHCDDFQDCSAAGRVATKEGFAAGLIKLVHAFPDFHTVLDDLVVDENAGRVAIRWSSIGTNRGKYLGIGPTGRRTPITGIEIIEVKDGRVARRWGEWDITAHK